ncbi:hypothetical protein K432DRAFT_208880 [Lepidopterella palustris CBS 459.81]|uniref:Uncharacterized protein n=1 Tax=Lepidopterella palustris CBS 459.81 TaxID=1314670 RepID=A0A8E2JI48_9PEZI|nr:hypothetical protein K432DRAFT_208880 [Lepidopterella palustris CBS 459.81]
MEILDLCSLFFERWHNCISVSVFPSLLFVFIPRSILFLLLLLCLSSAVASSSSSASFLLTCPQTSCQHLLRIYGNTESFPNDDDESCITTTTRNDEIPISIQDAVDGGGPLLCTAPVERTKAEHEFLFSSVRRPDDKKIQQLYTLAA